MNNYPSKVLYYSNYCAHSKDILYFLSKIDSSDLYFVCLDRRISKEGKLYAVLENGNELEIPSHIKEVPSLMLINQGDKLIIGEEIKRYMNKKLTQQQMRQEKELEPEAYSIGNFGTFHSDQYSFLDQGSEELMAQGSGGLRQIHNYVSIDSMDNIEIETPKDDYIPDKVRKSIDQIQQERDSMVPKQPQRF